MATSDQAPAECAQCGTALSPRAKACPECGADERTGWRETDPYDGLDLPESAFRDETDETPAPRPVPRVNGLAWYWWLAAALLLALLVLGAAGGLRADPSGT
ncbi:MAG: hypothetical protein B9S34_14970 [Opitutia bacterium Tous-C1TDCM]|nr:MAG: hypothetical protein B9S34_14970 [Opitutae bacterium Tous-C1TDCM]